MKDLSARMQAPSLRDEAIAWILATYRDLASIEAVARAAKVSGRTMHRYIDAYPVLRLGLSKLGHVRGAGNVARRKEEGEERALDLLHDLKGPLSVAGIAEACAVDPVTVARWQRVYPRARRRIRELRGKK